MAKEENPVSDTLAYLVAGHGGNNYWARTINGCDKVFVNEEKTANVAVSDRGRYILTVDMGFFTRCSVKMRKLVIIHEAAHIALRHIERLFRILSTVSDPITRAAVLDVFNYAADFAANDSIVSKEPEFAECHSPKDQNANTKVKGESWIPKEGPINTWTFLMPEEFGFPKGKSMDDYILLLLEDLPKVYKEICKALQDMQAEDDAAENDGGDGDNPGDGDGSGEGDPPPGTDDQESEGSGGSSSGSGKGKGKGKGGKSSSNGLGTDDDPNLPPGMRGKAHTQSAVFEAMKEMFKAVTGNNHQAWNKKASSMTPEEANTMSNRMKQHARALVKSAHEQTKRARGTVPAGIEALVKSLLEPEQVPWTIFFQDIVASAIHAKLIDAMAMPNADLLPLEDVEPWPGATMDTAFHITWFTDTSGSVHDVEYARAILEINGLLRGGKGVRMTYIECDAAIHKEEEVTNLTEPDDEQLKKLANRKGYGGTVYSPVFRRVLNMSRPGDYGSMKQPEEPHLKPDLMIIYTDGGVVIEGECFPQWRPPCGIIWLVAPGCIPAKGMETGNGDHVVQMFHLKGEFD